MKIEEAIRKRGLPSPLTTGLLMALPAAQAQSGSGACLAGKTLTIIVNQTAGQLRDLEARLPRTPVPPARRSGSEQWRSAE